MSGRDNHIICNALAYAIVTIERLPEEWQEASDAEDMRIMLADFCGEQMKNHYLKNAQGHIEQRGFVWENGEMKLAPLKEAAE